jgi:hypothetical protein
LGSNVKDGVFECLLSVVEVNAVLGEVLVLLFNVSFEVLLVGFFFTSHCDNGGRELFSNLVQEFGNLV